MTDAARQEPDRQKKSLPLSEAEPKQKPEQSVVLLKDWGARLPLGVMNADGAYQRDMVHKTWALEEEEELGRLRDRNQERNMAQYLSMVIATMYEQLGPYDFTKMKFAERCVAIGQMFMGDVYYAYVWLRRESLGNELELKLTCPRCSGEFPFAADLDTVKVGTAEALEPLLWDYQLKTPLDLRNKTVSKLVLGPARWVAIESLDPQGGLNTGSAKATVIRHSIHRIEELGGEVTLGNKELRRLVKLDIERITNELDQHLFGPNMAIEDKCPRCQRQFKLPLDWGYDSFFGISSP